MAKLIQCLSILSLSALFSACGVKGDPKPPLIPAAMGHGQPSFKRGTKILAPTQAVDPEATPPAKNSPSEQE